MQAQQALEVILTIFNKVSVIIAFAWTPNLTHMSKMFGYPALL